jgi:hypothetical protein
MGGGLPMLRQIRSNVHVQKMFGRGKGGANNRGCQGGAKRVCNGQILSVFKDTSCVWYSQGFESLAQRKQCCLIKPITNKMNKKMYVVKYNDAHGNGDNQNLEVIVENRNQFLSWLDEHNESRDAEPETEDEFELIPLNVYSSGSITIPIYYYEDDDNEKIYDFDEMTKEFEKAVYQLIKRK